jgi:hypothetical protein
MFPDATEKAHTETRTPDDGSLAGSFKAKRHTCRRHVHSNESGIKPTKLEMQRAAKPKWEPV